MKLPWKRIAEVAHRALRNRNEKPKLRVCPIDNTPLREVTGRTGLVQICARGHRYGPNEPRGELGPAEVSDGGI